jgi:hypothetical protein
MTSADFFQHWWMWACSVLCWEIVFLVGVFFLSIWVFILCSLGRRWMLVSRECVLMGVWFGRSCDVTCPVLISICVYDESVSNLWHFLHC